MSQTHPLTTTLFALPGCRAFKSFGLGRGKLSRAITIASGSPAARRGRSPHE